MTVISPYIDRTQIHHEKASNDITSHPWTETAAFGSATIVDEEAQRMQEKAEEDKAKEQGATEATNPSNTSSDRPPGLWLITGLGIYGLYRLLF